MEAEIRLGCGVPKHGPVCGLLAVEMAHQSVCIGLCAQAPAACTRQLCAAGSGLEGQMVDALPTAGAQNRISFWVITSQGYQGPWESCEGVEEEPVRGFRGWNCAFLSEIKAQPKVIFVLD